MEDFAVFLGVVLSLVVLICLITITNQIVAAVRELRKQNRLLEEQNALLGGMQAQLRTVVTK